MKKYVCDLLYTIFNGESIAAWVISEKPNELTKEKIEEIAGSDPTHYGDSRKFMSSVINHFHGLGYNVILLYSIMTSPGCWKMAIFLEKVED